MRSVLAFALVSMTVLAAAPAQGDTLATQVTGAGTGVATLGDCQTEVAIAFHLFFTGRLSPVLFPNPGCQGWVNAWVEDCRQEPSGIVCHASVEDGVEPVEGFLSLTHEGDFHFELPLDGVPFAVDGKVAFNQVVVPSL